MVNSHFGLSCSPFDNTLDQRFLFMSKGHEEVIAALLYSIREKKSFAVVYGDVGTGKTMIVHHLLGKLPRSVLPILVPYPDVEFMEILRYIARVLGFKPEGRGVLELADEVKAALSKAVLDSRRVVLIVDEAHLLSTRSLENIRLLSNLELAEDKLLQILLIGQNELGVKLRKTGMRQLLQRININRVLSPMAPSETIQYIDHRMKIAGSSFDRCFDPSCRKLLYEMTGGVPRNINRLCDTALLICSTEKGEKVTGRVLKKAHDAIDSDLIQEPGEDFRRTFFHVFSHVKKFKPAFVGALLSLLLAMGVIYTVENHQLSSIPERSSPGAGENGYSGGLSESGDHTALSSASSQPSVEGPDQAAVSETVAPDAAVDSFQKDPNSAQPVSEGEDRAAVGELEIKGAVPQTPEKRASETSDYFIVTVKKGESLTKIAAQWFPEDLEAGKKSILAANAQIRDENRILAGQTLKVPRKRGGE